MQALHKFLVEPIGERYNNVIKVGKKQLIINTKIETFKAVNKVAKVTQIPKNIITNINVGDMLTIWGGKILESKLEEVSKQFNNIPYHYLTSLSKRVLKEYG